MKPSGKLIILTYHRVGNEGDFVSRGMGGTGVWVEDFARQIKFLDEHCQVCTLRDALEISAGGETLRRPLAVVTFDDGYRDNHTRAWPILSQHKVPATIFLVAGIIGSGKLMWQHRMYYLKEAMGVAWMLKHVLVEQGDEKHAFSSAMRWLKAQGDTKARDALIDFLWEQAGLDRDLEQRLSNDMYLGWKEISEMDKGGIEFGSHSLTHPCLSALDGKMLRKEVGESKRLLEEKLSREIQTFAYPYGDAKALNPAVVQEVRQAGYRGACTAQWGINALPMAQPPHTLKRKGMNYSHPLRMWLEISGVKDRLRQWAGVAPK